MSKDTYYFQHDYNARTDMKIRKVIAKHGYLGYGIFWAIIEDLYNNANALPMDCDLIASDLKTKKNVIESIINDFDLFVINGENFSSKSVQQRLDDRAEKSFKAKESAKKRWEGANAMRSHTDSNAIKEKKGKEKKGEEVVKAVTTPASFISLTMAEVELSFSNDEFALLAIRRTKKTIEALELLVPQFLKDQKGLSKVLWKDVPDLRSHFINWVNKRPEEVPTQRKKPIDHSKL